MPLRAHRVLAAVSRGYPLPLGRFPRVTHPSATFTRAEALDHVRLACVRHAASVRSEPGSNSQVNVGPDPEAEAPETQIRQPDVLEDPVTRLLSPSRTPIPEPQSQSPEAEKTGNPKRSERSASRRSKALRQGPPPAHPFLNPNHVKQRKTGRPARTRRPPPNR